MKRWVALILCILAAIPVMSGCKSKEKDETYTLMIYMVGSDLESKYMAASNDLVEMLDSDIDPSRVNLLIYTGGSETWYADVPNDGNATLLLTEEDGEKSFEHLKKEDENKNMGEAETLTSFLDYAYENYRADHYGLIFWDHGCGPLFGFGSDSLFENDSMALSEMQKALDDSPFCDEKLDFVGFDACLMSSIEVADTLRPYADYMIASQETEPGDGWNYSFLDTFNDTYDTVDIAQSVIGSYHEYYEEQQSDTFNPDLTLACMDLSRIDDVTEAMNELFGEMKSTLDGGGYQKLAIDRSTMKTFGGSTGSRGWSLDMVDMGALLDNSAEDYPDETDALREALDDFVVINKTNISDTIGVSIYYPYDGSRVYANMGVDLYKTFEESQAYVSYMDTFTRTWSKDWLKAGNVVDEQTGSLSDDEFIEDEDKIIVKLTDEQKKNLSKVYLNVYRKPDEDYEFYVPQLYMAQLTPEEDGTVIVNADVKVPTINGYLPISLMQTSKDAEKASYKSICTSVSPSESLTGQELVTLNCTVENGSDDIIITSIDYINEEDTPVRSGKSSLNADRWATLIAINFGGKPVRDENGALRQLSEWETSASNQYVADIDSTLGLTMQSIGSQPYYRSSSYFYQIAVSDTSGNYTYSELERFPDKYTPPETTEEKTAKGVMTFELYDDYAMLDKYEGTDPALTIPEEVEGLPVTKIRYNAFASLSENNHILSSLTIENPDIDLSTCPNYNKIKKIILPDGLKNIPNNAFSLISEGTEVVIPDSVESIGAKAFYDYLPKKLKRLSLPQNLRSIGNSAFSGCTFEEGISFRGDNQYYQIKDDMLLTKDGKKLLNYFGSDTTLVIPEGVEEIAPYAHIGDDDDFALTKIEFPSTLKRVRYYAFYNDAFEELIFPDSVEEIGHFAFSTDMFFGDDSFVVSKIHLGKKLKWIGKTFLGESVYDELTVSEDNRFYTVKNNRLTNKAGYSDLSEVALSASDNLNKNQSEYARYRLATNGLDLSHYIKDEDRKYNKSFNGKDYCLKMELTDSAKENAKFQGSGEITIMGKKFTLPCRYSDFSALGLSVAHDPLPESVKENDLMHAYLGQDGSTLLNITAKNVGTEPTKPENCSAFGISSGNIFVDSKSREILDFEYLGVTQDSTIADVTKLLGEPTKIEIGSNSWIDLTYEVYDEENIYTLFPDSLEMTFCYDELSDTAVMLEVNIRYGYDKLADTAGVSATDDPKELEAQYKNYTAATGGIDVSRYRKSDKKTYNGKDFCLEMDLKTEEKGSYQGSADIKIDGKSFKMGSLYSSFPSIGFTPNKTDPINADMTGSLLLTRKEASEEIILGLQNAGEKQAKPEDCIIYCIWLGNPYSATDSRTIPEFDYLGLTRDAKISDVISRLGEPNEVTVRADGIILFYYEYDKSAEESVEAFYFGRNTAQFNFKTDPKTDSPILDTVIVQYGYKM